MMKSGQLRPGAKIKVIANGAEHVNIVTDIQDGRVTLRAEKHKGRWWLPYQYVKEHGTLLVTAPEEPKP